MAEQVSLSVEQVNQAFIDSQPYYNPVIAARAKRYNKIWGKLVPRGNFEYGQGYVKSNWTFHGGTADQTTARLWQEMSPSTPPNAQTGDPGSSACRYTAAIINYGIEQKQYKIYQTLRRTEDICLTDILFKWQVGQHIKAFMSTFADVTLGEWENFSRDAYIDFCTKIFAVEGLPPFAASTGCDEIDVTGVDLNAIGVLSQEILDRMYQYLYREAPMGAMGVKNMMPVFGILSSPETLTALISQDTEKRTDMRYTNPEFLVEGIGMTNEYKSWSHMQDPQTIRFKLNAAGTKLIRVFPYTDQQTTIGRKTLIDQEYIDAPFEISLVMLKDVFSILVPPSNPSFGSAKFDAIGNYGEFSWQNFKDRLTNPYGEIGFWDARFRGAPAPGDNSDRAFAILHRRNVGTRITLPDSCDTSPQTDAVNITAYATASLEATYTRITVVCAECLDGQLGHAAVIAVGGGSSYTGVISNYLGGTSYEVTFASALDYVALMAANNGTLTITTA